MGNDRRSPWEVLGATQRTGVMLLGTFHFAHPDLDECKPEKRVDVMADPLQQQVEEVVQRLVAFAPTQVCVEVMPARDAQLNADYRAYRSGEFRLGRNEVHQLGFQVAARLGHDRVYTIDAPGLIWDEESHLALERYAAEHGQQDLMNAWDDRFRQLYRSDENAGGTLRDMLLRMNDEQYVLAEHGAYLVGRFQVGVDEEYAGPDFIAKWWFDRNLRIFARIQRITESPDDRILVIIGAGHLAILRHCVQCSPMHALVEVASYLGD